MSSEEKSWSAKENIQVFHHSDFKRQVGLNPSHESHSWDSAMTSLSLLLSLLGLPLSAAVLTGKCQITEGWLKPHTTEPLSLCPSAPDTGLVALCSNVTSLPGDLAPVPEQANALCVSGSIDGLSDGAFSNFPELRYLSITINMSIISPRAFLGLGKLQYLSIQHSDADCCKSWIPTEVFQPLHQLQTLEMKGIQLRGQRRVALPSQLQSFSVAKCCWQHFSELFSIFPLKSVPWVAVDNCGTERIPYSFSSKDQHRNRLGLNDSPSWPPKERISSEGENGSLLHSLRLSQFPLDLNELLALEVDKLDSLSLEKINLLPENQSFPICVLATRFSLRSLTFSQNYNKSFVGEELPACRLLKNLVLEGNELEHVDSLLLYKLPHLLSLDLSENHLHWDLCPAVYKTMNFTSGLQILDFSGNNGTTLPAFPFSCLPHLQELSFNRCGLRTFDPLAFSGLNHLKILNIRENNMIRLHFFPKLPFLTSLDLRGNDIEVFWRPVFQNLTLLRDLQIGSYQVIPEIYFSVPNVTLFGLESGILIIFHSLVTTAFSSVQNMSLSGCYNFQNTENHSFFPSVRILHWESAFHYCQSSRPFHRHFPLLEQFIYKHKVDELFASDHFNLSHLSKLRILEVHNLPEDHYSPKEVQYYFMDLPSLEVLKVVNSRMKYISAAFFRRKSNLRNLVLESEDFLALDRDIQDQIEEQAYLRYLHFSKVTFRCDCSNAWLIDWATRKKGMYVSGLEQADCLDVIWWHKKQKFVSFVERNCSDNAGFLLFIATFSLLFFFVTLPLLNATCGSDFLFLAYMLRAWWKGMWNHNKGRRFEYDAFVSYSSQDQEWVLQHLVLNLEHNGPPFLKLCLHNRDFVVGKAIVDNIMESLYSSRKTICVISRNALESHWCTLEMSLATYRLIAEQEDTLILLFMEHIPRNQLLAYHRLAKRVKRKTYLEWPKETAAQAAFWDKLRGILGQDKANGQEKM
ncbi:toll-like receptor 12 [Paroedura picta]|uniref:toll-like receptor 12 n=1 Tax=Paroedura picta TaxID=143630 RepID=UPI0040579C15